MKPIYPHEVLQRIILHEHENLLISTLKNERVRMPPRCLHARLQFVSLIPKEEGGKRQEQRAQHLIFGILRLLRFAFF